MAWSYQRNQVSLTSWLRAMRNERRAKKLTAISYLQNKEIKKFENYEIFMPFQSFITKNSIELNSDLQQLCEDGIGFMEKTIDAIHDENHVYRLLEYLDEFLEYLDGKEIDETEKKISKDELNLKALTVAICWHDTWKTDRKPTNFFTFLGDAIWDGMGSMRKFQKYVNENYPDLDSEFIERVSYIIKMHSKVQIQKRKNIESKIMHDIDRLDLFSKTRWEKEKEQTLQRKPSKASYLAGKLYLNRVLKRQTDSKFYFQFFKDRFREMKDDALKIFEEGLEEYGAKL